MPWWDNLNVKIKNITVLFFSIYPNVLNSIHYITPSVSISLCLLHMFPQSITLYSSPLFSSPLLSYLDCKDTRCSSTNEYLQAPLLLMRTCPQRSSSPYALSPLVTSRSARSPDTAAGPRLSRMARRRRSFGQLLLGGESSVSSPRSYI